MDTCELTMSQSVIPPQTYTPYRLVALPHKQTLVNDFRGKPLNTLRTPAVVIDRSVFAQNCAKMHNNAKEWGASFRAHVKTHKVCTSCRCVCFAALQFLTDCRRRADAIGQLSRPNTCDCRFHVDGGMGSRESWAYRGWDCQRCRPERFRGRANMLLIIVPDLVWIALGYQ